MDCLTCDARDLDQVAFWSHVREGHRVAVAWGKEEDASASPASPQEQERNRHDEHLPHLP